MFDMVSGAAAQVARVAPEPNAELASGPCTHCGQPLSAGVSDGFCCAGCKAVHQALTAAGLDRFYLLRDGPGQPVGDLGLERRDRKWLEPLTASLGTWEGPKTLRLQVQGIRCAACVWLIEQLFERMGAGGRALVNPTTGALELTVDAQFPLERFVSELEALGYLTGPAAARPAGGRDDLLLRAGVCSALALNTMMFSAAIYLGLEEGALFRFLRSLNFGMSALAVLIGGPVFILSAWRALQRRVFHLDLPIAVAIAVTFAAACWSFVEGNDRAAYHDSLAVFVALMLVGRYLQERVVARNRDQLLASDGVDNLMTRRVGEAGLELIAAGRISQGDRLLIAPGDLVPVESILLDPEASCSLDWINGESRPVPIERGAQVPAGAFNVGPSAIQVKATADFERSTLWHLMVSPQQPAEAGLSVGFSHFAPLYVVAVLSTAAGGFAYWTRVTGDVVRGLEVATAVCVVTCPCAIGIATPLALELAHAGLRRMGLFVRRADYLARCRRVRQVVFDKTGTLTTGRLRVENPSVLAALSPADRNALHDMTARSLHPRSVALRHALEGLGASFDASAQVREKPGHGLEMERAGVRYRLGSAAWLDVGTASGLHFERDGQLLASIEVGERLRDDSRHELSRLSEMGYATWILSGDDPQRVARMGLALGIDGDRAVGGMDPEAKAAWIRAHDPDHTLMVGDGINDSLAVQAALCSGTPSIDRSFMPARTDFYFVTPGLAPIARSLTVARRVGTVTRRNVIFALLYNVGTVAMALSGNMYPWVAAILMPTSSLVIVAVTLASLSPRSPLWRS